MPYTKEACAVGAIAVAINTAALFGISYLVTDTFIPLPNQTSVSQTQEHCLVSLACSLVLGAIPASILTRCLVTREASPNFTLGATFGALFLNAAFSVIATLITMAAMGSFAEKENNVAITVATAGGLAALTGALYGYITARIYGHCRIRNNLNRLSLLSENTLTKAIEEFRQRNRTQSDASLSISVASTARTPLVKQSPWNSI